MCCLQPVRLVSSDYTRSASNLVSHSPTEDGASDWRAANSITTFSDISPSTKAEPGLAQAICYACLVLLSNPTTASTRRTEELLPLPEDVLKRVRMRKQFEDCLIVDDDADV